ncbi:four-helix bundle copper-binding protein [Jannaschia sp. S6380]|uniref:four-helix bundle copper-binding protein n=1 Tax=Jannaschia sp. S6380 TaxID=2926408 RepID=UPI001FF54C25|nr:four-helix bundle copper-binding protein [Jannaschia sp. S6380]MCK0167164.1 four-helix bundle copper-binding protein [Jannaschia sp. S6380]
MSIKEMIAEHPEVAGHDNEYLGDAVRHAMYCAAICNSCADACAAEEEARGACIRLCADCSDICTATYRVGSRRTGRNEAVIRSMLELCAQACDACADMCEQHDDAHCRRCAKMCRECAADCRKAAQNL